jgi:hypothetical protein
MSVRGFLQALFRPGARRRRPRHHGDDVGDTVRNAIGPIAGRRVSGHAEYDYLDRTAGADERPDPPSAGTASR